ncbi:alpha/beta hydrolase family protein [Flagellimonas flava]|uniref:Prolyl oligopeptidase family protein n=1 Tax=Flagellimonas flava TaxID=570519 RepID=A0A1M5IRG9_9FLAO|nr:prolyl oligopeptidase family serine peptidase [Allomuricauda flava]SHG30938.1 Prolyl oligopeptidase family protein [Allomuricauda flava]
MLRFSMVFMLLFASAQILAQANGEILKRTKLTSFDDLVDYINTNEVRDSIKLDANRFEYFDKVQVHGITYWSDSLKVNGFLLQPKARGKYPAIIYNRGGSLDFGSLTHGVASIGLGELARIAHEGYVIAASQYRGNGGSEGAEEYGGSDIKDVLNLIPVLESIPNADTTKMGMFGWSRGAMTSFLTITQTDRIKAVVVGGPSTNLIRSIVDRPGLDLWWSEFIPNYSVSKKAILEKRSAVYWAHELPKNIPILMFQGGNDEAVLTDYVLDFAKELTKHKVPYRLVKFEDGSHSLKEHREEVYEALFAWFEKYLN